MPISLAIPSKTAFKFSEYEKQLWERHKSSEPFHQALTSQICQHFTIVVKEIVSLVLNTVFPALFFRKKVFRLSFLCYFQKKQIVNSEVYS
jgi:hypothetical protein